jgi:hypothetical protein
MEAALVNQKQTLKMKQVKIPAEKAKRIIADIEIISRGSCPKPAVLVE